MCDRRALLGVRGLLITDVRELTESILHVDVPALGDTYLDPGFIRGRAHHQDIERAQTDKAVPLYLWVEGVDLLGVDPAEREALREVELGEFSISMHQVPPSHGAHFGLFDSVEVGEAEVVPDLVGERLGAKATVEVAPVGGHLDDGVGLVCRERPDPGGVRRAGGCRPCEVARLRLAFRVAPIPRVRVAVVTPLIDGFAIVVHVSDIDDAIATARGRGARGDRGVLCIDDSVTVVVDAITHLCRVCCRHTRGGGIEVERRGDEDDRVGVDEGCAGLEEIREIVSVVIDLESSGDDFLGPGLPAVLDEDVVHRLVDVYGAKDLPFDVESSAGDLTEVVAYASDSPLTVGLSGHQGAHPVVLELLDGCGVGVESRILEVREDHEHFSSPELMSRAREGGEPLAVCAACRPPYAGLERRGLSAVHPERRPLCGVVPVRGECERGRGDDRSLLIFGHERVRPRTCSSQKSDLRRTRPPVFVPESKRPSPLRQGERTCLSLGRLPFDDELEVVEGERRGGVDDDIDLAIRPDIDRGEGAKDDLTLLHVPEIIGHIGRGGGVLIKRLFTHIPRPLIRRGEVGVGEEVTWLPTCQCDAAREGQSDDIEERGVWRSKRSGVSYHL